jgi:hypothetical protein
MKKGVMKKSAFGCLLMLCLLSNVAFSSVADKGHSPQNVKPVLKKKPSQYFGVTFENDAFLRDDALYTSGLFVYWGYHNLDRLDKTTLPAWISFLTQYTYLANGPNKSHDISYSVGQILQTPDNLDSTKIIEDDVPYAGLLGWNVRLQSFDSVIDDQIGLTLGAVGPIAEGEVLQKAWHDVIGSPDPNGWDNQLGAEVVVRLDTLRKWRVYHKSFNFTQIDFITGGGAGVGNLKSDLDVGLTARWGTSLQKSYAAAALFTTQQFNGLKPIPFGWYIFTNITGSYVFNDIFIDGNTFKDSHSVALTHEQLALSGGIMMNLGHFNVIYSEVLLSGQYKTQVEQSRFGALSITYKF